MQRWRKLADGRALTNRWRTRRFIFHSHRDNEGQVLRRAQRGSFTHWLFTALLTTFFPKMVAQFAPGYVFLLFCCMMVLQLIWVKTMVPETKGVSLEDMQRKLPIDESTPGIPAKTSARGGNN
jgi:hypothetical protein